MTVDAGLRILFRQHLPQFDWQSIETGATGRGVPDANYCCNGIEGWIEMKSATHWRAKVRPEQVGWAARRLDHGGRVFAAVRKGRDSLFLYHGSRLRDLCSERLDVVPALGRWDGGPGRWDWREVGNLLLFKNTC